MFGVDAARLIYSFGKGREAIRGAVKIFGADAVNFVGSAVSMFYGGAWGAAAWNYEFNRAMGVSRSAAFRSAAIAGASAFAFSKIGAHYREVASGDISFGGNMMTSGQIAGQITAHAMVGGVAASLQGGKFGHGFFSAGVGKGLGGRFLPGGSELTAGEVVYGTVVSAMIGGTASVVAGGKFANGAQTAAMQYLVNQAGAKLSAWQRHRLQSRIQKDATTRRNELGRWWRAGNVEHIIERYPHLSRYHNDTDGLALHVWDLDDQYRDIAVLTLNAQMGNLPALGVEFAAEQALGYVLLRKLTLPLRWSAQMAGMGGPPPPTLRHRFIYDSGSRVELEFYWD